MLVLYCIVIPELEDNLGTNIFVKIDHLFFKHIFKYLI